MTTLPASIEAYLLESGFSSTEILVLKRLLEGEALTLRELAAKTGKSTGVLDQATRKLSDKGIVSRENINDTQKYAIGSLTAIQQWIEADSEDKHATLARKKENFDAFLATVEHETGRPDMEFFEGVEGVHKAFEKLLTMECKEWLQYIPDVKREEDDPLFPYRVEMFRERRRRKTFMRVIAPNTSIGRRYQSKDVFEYRKTLLVPEKEFPVSFEKFVVGDVVACIDLGEQKASFIRYPALAEEQRNFFEMMWKHAETGTALPVSAAPPVAPKVDPEVAMETQVVSSVREFFMSKASLVTLAVLGVVAAGLTWGMYESNLQMNKMRFSERAVAIASTAALQINGDLLREIRTKEDFYSAAYQSIFIQLNEIRKQNENVAYIYILRPYDDPKMFEWIVDADSNYNLPFLHDANADGVLSEADEAVFPGQIYDVSSISELANADLREPIITNNFNEDQWGRFMTGYAPIRNSRGEVAGVLGVDYWASDVQELTFESFQPVVFFFGLFLVFIAVRLMAFHRSLLKELLQLSKTKKVLATLAGCSLIALLVTFGMYWYTLELMKEEIGQRLMSIVATAVPEINYADVQEVYESKDMLSAAYQRIYGKLNEIRDQNLNLQYVYIMHPSAEPDMYEFIADADTNFDVSSDADPEPVPPGTPYDVRQLAQVGEENQLLLRPLYDTNFTSDKWGTYLSASAPVVDQDGRGIAILGVDMNVSDVYGSVNNSFEAYIWFFATLSLIIFIRTLFLHIHKQVPNSH